VFHYLGNKIYINALCVILRGLNLLVLPFIFYRYKTVVLKLGILLHFIAWGYKIEKPVK
jgi:hypothetical protein